MILGILLGIVLGRQPACVASRLFNQLIRRGQGRRALRLPEISDKGCQLDGTADLRSALQATDSYRVAIISLVAFFVIGFVALLAIPMRRAIEAVGNVPPPVL